MNSIQTTHRVTYSDTDQMGFMHHSNYLKYYETARWELFRALGISYHSVEEAGYLLPVIRMNSRFRKTIHYDEWLTVKTSLTMIKGPRIWFNYKLYNSEQILVNEAETELAFISKADWKPCLAPEIVIHAIHEFQKPADRRQE